MFTEFLLRSFVTAIIAISAISVFGQDYKSTEAADALLATSAKPFAFQTPLRSSLTVARANPDHTLSWHFMDAITGEISVVNFGSSDFCQLSPADFNGDKKTDLACFGNRRGYGFFDVFGQGQTLFGSGSDITQEAADLDGDSKYEKVVTRHEGTAVAHYIRKSATGSVVKIIWGTIDMYHLPMQDYTGDGLADLVAVDTSGTIAPVNLFWVLNPATGTHFITQFGPITGVVVPGNFTGDDRADFVVYNPQTSTWHILENGSSGLTQQIVWGIQKGDPVRGDFDGDGYNDIAFYQWVWGAWWIRKSSDGMPILRYFGTQNDLVVNRIGIP